MTYCFTRSHTKSNTKLHVCDTTTYHYMNYGGKCKEKIAFSTEEKFFSD